MAVLKSLVISQTLLLTVNVHSISFESVGSWKPVQVTVEASVEGGQTPQSDVMMYSIVEQGEGREVQLNDTCSPLMLKRFTTFGGG